jgi:hypothetical protein
MISMSIWELAGLSEQQLVDIDKSDNIDIYTKTLARRLLVRYYNYMETINGTVPNKTKDGDAL